MKGLRSIRAAVEGNLFKEAEGVGTQAGTAELVHVGVGQKVERSQEACLGADVTD